MCDSKTERETQFSSGSIFSCSLHHMMMPSLKRSSIMSTASFQQIKGRFIPHEKTTRGQFKNRFPFTNTNMKVKVHSSHWRPILSSIFVGSGREWIQVESLEAVFLSSSLYYILSVDCLPIKSLFVVQMMSVSFSYSCSSCCTQLNYKFSCSSCFRADSFSISFLGLSLSHCNSLSLPFIPSSDDDLFLLSFPLEDQKGQTKRSMCLEAGDGLKT